MLSMYVDEEGHWVVICDRCSREDRTEKPHEQTSISMMANWLDALFVHHESHPRDTREPDPEVDDDLDIGDDEDVEPLPGALKE